MTQKPVCQERRHYAENIHTGPQITEPRFREAVIFEKGGPGDHAAKDPGHGNQKTDAVNESDSLDVPRIRRGLECLAPDPRECAFESCPLRVNFLVGKDQ